MKRLTLKQRRWLKSYLKTGNATQAAKEAGYQAKSDAAFEQIGFQNVRKLERHISQWLDENELSETRLKQLLVEGLEAKETKFFSHEGLVTEAREVVAWGPRRAFLDMALKVKGLYAPERHAVEMTLDKACEEVNRRYRERVNAKPKRERSPEDPVGDQGGEPEPAPEPEEAFDFEIEDHD
jgi:phage terminase small subunit